MRRQLMHPSSESGCWTVCYRQIVPGTSVHLQKSTISVFTGYLHVCNRLQANSITSDAPAKVARYMGEAHLMDARGLSRQSISLKVISRPAYNAPRCAAEILPFLLASRFL